MRTSLLLCCALLGLACVGQPEGEEISISASAVGTEGAILRRQISRFEIARPGVRVRIQQTPDDATQRHQLYVQWLNARLGEPDVLQLDVVWTPELAAAGWILPLGSVEKARSDFLPATIEANAWQKQLYALPWFVDVGMLYRRSDLVPQAPATLGDIATESRRRPPAVASGFVWQGARYEGLITNFVEILAAHGGSILDGNGLPHLDSPAGIAALRWMKSAINTGVSPVAVLTWHEEETRFAFQNGNALFMRNWPYAAALLNDPTQSAVASQVAVSPMPPAATGLRSAAALGGSQLAINRWSRHPRLALDLIEFLTAPAQMLERARATGQYPSRLTLYGTAELDRALHADSRNIRAIVLAAVPRPSTPVYSEISEALQIELHRSLSGETTPEKALASADREIAKILERSGLMVRRQ